MSTAYQFWDGQWARESGRKAWSTPDVRIVAGARHRIESAGNCRVLDLGCGAGRHALALARLGFPVSASDASQQSVAFVTQAASSENLGIEVKLAPMHKLPWEAGSFDWVIAWNVIYHATFGELRDAVAEIRRVTAPQACIEGTFISKRNSHFGKGQALDAHTFVNPEQGDKEHAHCYLDQADIAGLMDFGRFEVLEEYDQGSYPDAWHWYFKFRKEK